MSRYGSGRRAEYRSRDVLVADGFYVVRAAGSKGCFDLVAIGPDVVVLVQCKKGTRWPSPAELERMRAVPCPPGTQKVVHLWRPRASTPETREVPA